MRTFNYLLGIIVVVMTITACDKDSDSNKTGAISVRMTDAPANFTAVNVDIRSVEVHYADNEAGGENGWTSLYTKAGIYNLLELQDSLSVVIADRSALPVGHITQLRLILGNNNTVEIDSVDVYPLQTPSAQQSGLKIKLNAEIKAAGKTEILLDFDAGESIITKGNGEYSLKPVIKLEEILYL